MKKVLSVILALYVGAVCFSSCIVSKKKYDEATARADREHATSESLKNKLAAEQEIINKQNGTINGLKSNIKALYERIARMQDSILDLQDRVAVLEKQVNDQQGKISKLNGKVSKLGSDNEDAAQQLDKTKAEIAAQRKRMEQLQAFIDQQQAATEALRKKIADALVGFKSNELTITNKNGKVYISMQESLLFPSGSAVVNPKGKEALSKVASVLNTSKDINIDIEGHTDSLAIHNKQFADNWALSTARATSIAHSLIDDYSVSPVKLIASGRSYYDPVATNATPEGRAQNRRTEIILEPKLDELMQMINNKP